MPYGNSQSVDATGTVDSISTGKISLTTDGNKPLVVAMQGSKTHVDVTGSASAEFLKAGMCVEFVAEVQKGGQVEQLVEHLSVISPAFAKSGSRVSPAPAKIKPLDPGIPADRTTVRPRAGGGNLAGISAAPEVVSAKTALPATCTVRGQIKSVRDGNLVVGTTSGLTIKARLAPEPQIDVHVSDYQVAARGDKIRITGKNGNGLVVAESVQIDVTGMMSGGKKRSPKIEPRHARTRIPSRWRKPPNE